MHAVADLMNEGQQVHSIRRRLAVEILGPQPISAHRRTARRAMSPELKTPDDPPASLFIDRCDHLAQRLFPVRRSDDNVSELQGGIQRPALLPPERQLAQFVGGKLL